jgi:hypothetical protein
LLALVTREFRLETGGDIKSPRRVFGVARRNRADDFIGKGVMHRHNPISGNFLAANAHAFGDDGAGHVRPR